MNGRKRESKRKREWKRNKVERIRGTEKGIQRNRERWSERKKERN